MARQLSDKFEPELELTQSYKGMAMALYSVQPEVAVIAATGHAEIMSVGAQSVAGRAQCWLLQGGVGVLSRCTSPQLRCSPRPQLARLRLCHGCVS